MEELLQIVPAAAVEKQKVVQQCLQVLQTDAVDAEFEHPESRHCYLNYYVHSQPRAADHGAFLRCCHCCGKGAVVGETLTSIALLQSLKLLNARCNCCCFFFFVAAAAAADGDTDFSPEVPLENEEHQQVVSVAVGSILEVAAAAAPRLLLLV